MWAHGAGQREIAHGLPGNNTTLTFCSAPGVEAYGKLVSKPGLTATVVLNPETSSILNVRFHNRSRS